MAFVGIAFYIIRPAETCDVVVATAVILMRLRQGPPRLWHLHVFLQSDHPAVDDAGRIHHVWDQSIPGAHIRQVCTQVHASGAIFHKLRTIKGSLPRTVTAQSRAHEFVCCVSRAGRATTHIIGRARGYSRCRGCCGGAAAANLPGYNESQNLSYLHGVLTGCIKGMAFI